MCSGDPGPALLSTELCAPYALNPWFLLAVLNIDLEFQLMTLPGVMSTELLLPEGVLAGSDPFIVDISHLLLCNA